VIPVWRRRIVAAAGLLLAGAFLVGGLLQARIETGIDSFLPSADPAMQRYERLAGSFGGDAVVALIETDKPRTLLAGQRLPTVLGLEGRLSRLPDVARVYGPATTLNQIAGRAQELLAELTGRRDGLEAAAERQARERGASPAEVRRAGERAVAAFDQRYGPLIVEGLPVGLPTLRNQQFVNSVIFNEAGEAKPQWRYVVPNEHSVAILLRPVERLDQQATEHLVSTVEDVIGRADLGASRVTVAGAPDIVAELGEQARREIPLLGAVAVAAIGLCLVGVPWTPRRRDRLLPLGVTVLASGLAVAGLGWLGNAVSLGVVAFLPVLIGLGSYYTTYFVRGASTRVVLTIAAATAASFLALALSPLPFVRDLGLTFAAGVGFAVALGWLAARLRGGSAADVEAALVRVPPSAPRSRRLPGACAILALAAIGWAALPSVPLQTNFQDLTAGLAATEDARHVEEAIGSSGELAVVLRGENVLTPAAWRWMQAAQATVITEHGDDMRPILSPPGLFGFLGTSPTPEQIHSAYRLLPPYLSRAVINEDARVAQLSYGVRMGDLDRLARLTGELRTELPPPPKGYAAELSGLPMVAVRGYELVSADRYLLSFAGMLAAGLVLLAGLRRRTDALRSVAAASIATGIELLLIWAFGVPLNPVTVALGSLTAAVACEFTVMLAESTRRRTKGLHVVVLLAMLTSAAGYAVLGLSQLAVMRQFGLLLAISVGLSYLAARFVLWAWPARRVRAGATQPAETDVPVLTSTMGGA